MKILMVCLGNICRSPLAHGIMEKLAADNGLDWTVDSAGTGNWHIGQGPDKRSVRTAFEHGIDISDQICRLFRVSDFDDYDVIYVMDKSNLRDVLSLARNNADAAKVKLLLDNKEVPDPYHDDTQFEPVFNMVEQGCQAIINKYLKR